MNTLYLDPDAWDLRVDSSGNIALAGDPYATAQSAANAIRTFAGEVYYQTSVGVPYWSNILGHLPPLTYVKGQLADAAETVLGVASAQVFITSFENRVLRGQVQVTGEDGNTSAASF